MFENETTLDRQRNDEDNQAECLKSTTWVLACLEFNLERQKYSFFIRNWFIRNEY